MASGKSLPIFAIVLLFISNITLASMCARLKSVSAGEDHSLALADNGTLWACGGSSINHKQLGLGSDVHDVLSLRQVLGEGGNGHLQNVATYDAGWKHSLAADANGTIYAWGYDSSGQLGNGSGNDPCDFPAKVHGLNNVGYLSDTVDIVYVSAGRSGLHSLAVDSNGYVYAWGLNSSGQCGDGGYVDNQSPILVLDSNTQTQGRYLGDEAHIIAVDAGVDHSIALDDEGFVWEWGANNGYPYPQKVPGVDGIGFLNHIVGISTCYHSVAVDSNGFVYEWQNDNPYKVPCGQMDTSSGYLENIVEVSAGTGYSMARTSDGHVLVWSNGEYAYPENVEDGEMENPSGLLEGIISISGGVYDHKLAVCERGHGWAWGSNNDYGKFGVGDTNPRPEPAQMLCAEVPAYIYLAKTLEGNEPNCVSFNDYITYRITYGPNSYDHNNVVLTDFLPSEVDYVSSSPDGNYNNVLHAFTWTIGHLDDNDPCDSVTLTVKVDKCAKSDGIITNCCQIENDIGYSEAEHVAYLCSASNPRPSCGELSDFLCTDTPSLTWCPGRFAANTNGHEVYLGSNFSDVNNANTSTPNIYKGTVTNPSYPVGSDNLRLGTTYWRIDEVNIAHPDVRWKGSVWSFTTDCYLIDNFNSYVDNAAIKAVWKGYDPSLDPLNCATVFTNQTTVRDTQSMRYVFENCTYEPYYSEARADVNTARPNGLGKTSNWLDMGATVLSLWFYGGNNESDTATNDPNEQMYVKLTDGDNVSGTVKYPNMSDIL
jgi:uncharacterized repeat protein (TIGR01451 family)